MKKEDAKNKAKTVYEEIQGGVNEVISKIRELIKEGSARKLIIKNKEGKVVFQTQLTMGVGGAALIGAMAPVISAIGMFAMFLNDMTILVEKEVNDEDEYSVDAEVIDITDEEEEEETEPVSDTTSKTKEEKPGEEKEKTVGKKK
ncbi:MAG: DUF4342 domain-containing protein [Balneolaceae bacterium]